MQTKATIPVKEYDAPECVPTYQFESKHRKQQWVGSQKLWPMYQHQSLQTDLIDQLENSHYNLHGELREDGYSQKGWKGLMGQ